MVIVVLLSLTVSPLEKEVLIRFLFGGFLVIIGLTLFLLGVDIGLLPVGEKLGSTLTEKKNIFLLLSVSFFIGALVTIAEPDVQVLSDQIRHVSPGVSKWLLVLGISFGVGVFIVIGLCRTVFSWNLRTVLIISYILLFALAFLCPKELQGSAFDSGGATTGPMTVPFIMALGLGVASVRSGGKSKEDSSFGLTGLSSIGPIMAVCVYGMVLNMKGSEVGLEKEVAEVSSLEVSSSLSVFLAYLPKVVYEVFFSLFPLILMFIIFQFLFLKFPPFKISKIMKGLLYSFLGLILFLTGAEVGFMPAGRCLGYSLMQVALIKGGCGIFLIIAVSFAFGAITVCAEPAVWVLTEQVESASGGNIRKSLMLSSLSLGVAFSVVLCILRFLFGFSLWVILIPGYFIALLLTFFCPPLFTGIAFDSGGVASGPMTTTFILSFTLGVAEASVLSSASGGVFGVIALVAMTPLISIQILGCVFRIKTRKRKEKAK